MQSIELAVVDRDGSERIETFVGTLIVESNSGPHAGTRLYRDSAKRFIGYDTQSRRCWMFEHVPDDDEILTYCDSDEEFLAALLKLGRSTAY